MKRIACLILLAAAVAMVLPQALRGGPPFFTDDPCALLLRQWEFFLGSTGFVSDGLTSMTSPHLEMNYGASRDVMLHVIFPLNYVQPAGAPAQYGLGDIELGFIFRFAGNRNAGLDIGIFPHLQLPTGSHARGLGNGRAQVFLPLWFMKSSGPWCTFGGGGYWTNPGPGNKNYGQFGWVVQRDISKVVALGFELFGNTPVRTSAPGRVAFNIEAVVSIDSRQQILLSAGRDIRGVAEFSMYIGYHLLLGPVESRGERELIESRIKARLAGSKACGGEIY